MCGVVVPASPAVHGADERACHALGSWRPAGNLLTRAPIAHLIDWVTILESPEA
jgi:hypothetical protein